MKKCILILFAFTIFSQANSQSSFATTYNYGNLLSSDMSTFINNDSWRGWQFEYMYALKPNVSIGLLSGYQGFYEKRARGTYTSGTSAVNAVTWRYFTNVPLLATIKYFFGQTNFRPYIGAGLGAGFSNQEIQFGDFAIQESTTNFEALGELGLSYKINGYWSLLLNIKYNYSPYSSDNFDTKNISYITVGAGAAVHF